MGRLSKLLGIALGEAKAGEKAAKGAAREVEHTADVSKAAETMAGDAKVAKQANPHYIAGSAEAKAAEAAHAAEQAKKAETVSQHQRSSKATEPPHNSGAKNTEHTEAPNNKTSSAEKDAEEIAKLLAAKKFNIHDIATDLDAAARGKTAIRIENLNIKLDNLKNDLLEIGKIIPGGRSNLSPAQIMERIKSDKSVSLDDFSALKNHLQVKHGVDSKTAIDQTTNNSPPTNNFMAALVSPVKDAARSIYVRDKSLDHVRAYLGKDYKSSSEILLYENWFERHPFVSRTAATLTLLTSGAFFAGVASDDNDNNMGWPAKLEYQAKKAWAGVIPDYKKEILLSKNDGQVDNALKKVLTESDKDPIEAAKSKLISEKDTIVAEKDTIAAEKDKIITELEKQTVDVDLQIVRGLHGDNGTQKLYPTQTQQSITEQFNKIVADEDLGLADKKTILIGAFNKAKNGDEFEAELKKAQITPDVSKYVRGLVYEN